MQAQLNQQVAKIIDEGTGAKRSVIVSPINTTPPIAAITGTDNWTTAACVVDRPPSAMYQIVYPKPDAIAPDRIA